MRRGEVPRTVVVDDLDKGSRAGLGCSLSLMRWISRSGADMCAYI